jgi:putative spermidine/putrescine transport system permease protein
MTETTIDTRVRRRGLGRRLSSYLFRHRRLQLGGLLAGPIGWLAIAYLGSLAILFLASFWRLDPFSGKVIHEYGLQNFEELASNPVYRTITLRTVATAAAVTVTCALIAFPIAYYMARIASERGRRLLVIAVLMPLWASYLVKVYAWQILFQRDGLLDWLLAPIGLSSPFEISGTAEWKQYAAVWITFTYLWLPYMILPLYAGLERIPSSLLEASSDLGGHAGTTFRRVVLPLAFPAVVAGSIFTFSLTLGDYITPQLVSSTQFIGNVVYANVGVANNLPFAAAYATVPVVIMVVYLAIARRLGAFEHV